MTAAEMPVALPRHDGTADIAVFPKVDPGLGDLVGRRLIQDVRLCGIVEGDVGDSVAFLIVDGQVGILPWDYGCEQRLH